jgi:hypothetical protein
MGENLGTKRGEVVGIGTINSLKFKNLTKKLPVFSFVVLQGKNGEKGLFIATCIDLRIDGYGNSDLNAIECMNKNVCRFLLENFTNPKCKENAWGNLERLSRFDDWSKELWNVYRTALYKFAEKNKSLYSMSILEQKEKQEVVFISPQGAKSKDIEFNPAIIGLRKPASAAYSPVQSISLLGGIILGQMADLRNMKIKPWLQQPEEGKKRCIQPLQL